jgi:hypothetical protein
MVNRHGIARLGMLAVGLGIGAGWAHMPIASADTPSDAASTVDGLVSGVSPAAATPINLDISFDGYTIYDGGGTAVADTGTAGNGNFDFAIAYGADSSATAEGGTGDYALASGTNALANAGSLTAGATGNNYDIAEDIGNNVDPYPDSPDGAFAGAGSLYGNADSGTSSDDTAIDIGNSSGGGDGAFAGDGQLFAYGGAGNGDTAYTFGNIDGNEDGSGALTGDYNYAGMFGTETGNVDGAYSGTGNGNSAIADTSYTTNNSEVVAGDGNDNYAYVYGPDNSTADAGGTSTEVGNNDIAYVSDPFASATSEASSAIAGSTDTAAGSNDLAEVLLTQGNAVADGGNLLYDIISLFGNIASP